MGRHSTRKAIRQNARKAIRRKERAARRFDKLCPPNPDFGEVFDGLEPGGMLAGFEYQRRLGGNSGQSVAARVRNPATKTLLAMIIPTNNPQAAVQLYQALLDSLTPIRHPCIPKYHNIGYFKKNQPYLMMDFIPGERIDLFCDRKRLSVRSRLKLFSRLCAGVAALHDHGVSHLDLKPDNILTMQSLWPKIIDYGAMRQLGAAIPKNHPGTSHYKAPERYANATASPQMDVYSLGVILYELMVGFRPYSQHAAGIVANIGDDPVELAVQEHQPESPSALLNYLPATLSGRCNVRSADPDRLETFLEQHLDAIALASVAKDSGMRTPTARELGASIENVIPHF